MEKLGTPIGSYAPDFELPGVDGAVHHLAQYLKQFQALGVIFMCNHCPYVQLYLERLKNLQSKFQDQGMIFIGINANDDSQYPEDSFANMKQFATNNQLNFPYLRDVSQDVARSFGAQRTPEVFLLDQQGMLRYRGAIDDNAQADLVNTSYLQEAIAELLTHQAVTIPAVDPVGCSIKWRP